MASSRAEVEDLSSLCWRGASVVIRWAGEWDTDNEPEIDDEARRGRLSCSLASTSHMGRGFAPLRTTSRWPLG